MKKIIKIIGIFILVIIGIHLLFVSYVWISNSIYLEGENQKRIEYLISNYSSTSQNEVGESLFEGVFDDDFYENSVFLLGESHGFEDVQKIDLTLLKHLHKKIGLRYYIAEMDRELAEKLNTFIQDSIRDANLLNEIITKMKDRIPQQASQELYNKWNEVREYNLTLPDSQKINVLGIDKSFTDHQNQISRDSAMVKNLTQYIKTYNLENEKFYGLFGYFHVMQEQIGELTYKPFASRLVESNNKDIKKVTSLVVYHLNSDVYFPKNKQFPTPDSEVISILNDDGPITLVKGINDLESITEPNTINLFNLNGNDSPYKESQYLAGIKVNFFGDNLLPSNTNNTTIDFFQYVILGRNSKALTKFEKNANNVSKR